MKNLTFFFSVLLIIFILDCKSDSEKVVETISSGNNFPDEYKDNTYTNHFLNLSMFFDIDWVLKTDYIHFDSFEKEYADSFNSKNSELLFAGYNESIKAGVRATIDKSNLAGDVYFEKLKNAGSSLIYRFKPEYKKNEFIYLDNFMAYQTLMKVTLNNNNIYIFDSIFFTISTYTIRLDFWIQEQDYEENSNYFYKTYNSILFIFDEKDKINKTDQTDDLIIQN